MVKEYLAQIRVTYVMHSVQEPLTLAMSCCWPTLTARYAMSVCRPSVVRLTIIPRKPNQDRLTFTIEHSWHR